MEHCTGGSKEIKFNITYRDKLFRENNMSIHNQLLLNNLQVISQKYGRNL